MHTGSKCRKKRQLKQSLKDWINDNGVEHVAKLLKVEQATVRHWRRGANFPRVDQMRVIKKITKGRVGYEEIIDLPVDKPTISNAGGSR